MRFASTVTALAAASWWCDGMDHPYDPCVEVKAGPSGAHGRYGTKAECLEHCKQETEVALAAVGCSPDMCEPARGFTCELSPKGIPVCVCTDCVSEAAGRCVVARAAEPAGTEQECASYTDPEHCTLGGWCTWETAEAESAGPLAWECETQPFGCVVMHEKPDMKRGAFPTKAACEETCKETAEVLV